MPTKAAATAVKTKPANSPVRRATPPAKLIPLPDGESPAQVKPARQKRTPTPKPTALPLPAGHILTPSLVVNGLEVGSRIVRVPSRMGFFNKPKKRNKATVSK